MYITITPQKIGGNYSQSSGDFVGYLEKENQGLEQQDMEHFFNQFGDEISAEEVVKEIDGAKNGQSEPLKTDFFEPLKKTFQTML